MPGSGFLWCAVTGAVLVQVALAVNRLKYRLIESKNAPGDVRGICGPAKKLCKLSFYTASKSGAFQMSLKH
ncbi:hypothetical protein ASQ50_20055 [Marinobacter sp. LQ44]|nr:hypothetical protein ASQ50_20055 [Marinobacter sp. LQ44]